jgi:hypothetical protein
MAFATMADLMAYTGEDSLGPGDERRLERATILVASQLSAAYYTTDSSGNPTDAGVLVALRNAVCAQVEYWRVTGDEFGAQGMYRSAPGAQVGRGVQVLGTGKQRLCPRAMDELNVKGIWRHKPLAW